MDSTTHDAGRSRLGRRTVVAGAAWAVPAVLVAQPVPAMALSGNPPNLVLKKACKLPGNSCGDALKKSYKFNFDVTNTSAHTIYICNVTFTATNTNVDPLVWYAPGGPGSCLTVPANTTTNINIFANSNSSANLTFTTTMTVTWAHACPCANDPEPHAPVVKTITVSGTSPDCISCTGPN